MRYPNMKKGALALSIVASLGLTACSDSDNIAQMPEPPVMQDYRVTVTNLTANQPFSPITLVAHGSANPLWSTGEMASVALEKLAESGDNADFAAETGVSKVEAGGGILAPGATESVTISLTPEQSQSLTVLTMLVNTNDAFTGIGNYSLGSLAAGDMVSLRAITYDAGTEANSEAKGTIPGPADGGEGFNAERDDVDRVHAHPGVISADDGLADSVLSASHRFDNPTMAVKIERVK